MQASVCSRDSCRRMNEETDELVTVRRIVNFRSVLNKEFVGILTGARIGGRHTIVVHSVQMNASLDEDARDLLHYLH